MPSLGPWELLIILVIVVIIFGVGKLPEIGGAMGKGIREFRASAKDDGDSPTGATSTTEMRSETTTVRNEPVKEEL